MSWYQRWGIIDAIAIPRGSEKVPAFFCFHVKTSSFAMTWLEASKRSPSLSTVTRDRAVQQPMVFRSENRIRSRGGSLSNSPSESFARL